MGRRVGLRPGLGALVVAVAVAAVAVVPGCARSEVDICVDHLRQIKRESSARLEPQCVDLVERNGGRSPF